MSILNKDHALELVGVASQQHQQTKKQFWDDRENLINKIEEAKNNGATQQQIADAARLSRQRVAQFLKERRENKEPKEW